MTQPVDFKSKLMKFLSMKPEELLKAYPTVDPYKLVDQLNSQGLQTQGQMFGGVATPDAGLLKAAPGVPPQGGQGFQLPADNPFAPRNPDATNIADYANVQPPGLKIPEAGGMAAPTAAPGINPLLIASLGQAMMQPQQPQAPLAPPPVSNARLGAGPAQSVLQVPEMPQLQNAMLQNLLQRSLYG